MNVEAYTCLLYNDFLGGAFKDCLFSPRRIGEMIQFDEHIFQIVGCNHHLVNYLEILGGSSHLHSKTM